MDIQHRAKEDAASMDETEWRAEVLTASRLSMEVLIRHEEQIETNRRDIDRIRFGAMVGLSLVTLAGALVGIVAIMTGRVG